MAFKEHFGGGFPLLLTTKLHVLLKYTLYKGHTYMCENVVFKIWLPPTYSHEPWKVLISLIKSSNRAQMLFSYNNNKQCIVFSKYSLEVIWTIWGIINILNKFRKCNVRGRYLYGVSNRKIYKMIYWQVYKKRYKDFFRRYRCFMSSASVGTEVISLQNVEEALMCTRKAFFRKVTWRY